MMSAILHVSRYFIPYACLAYVIAAIERIGEALLTDGPYWAIRQHMMTQYFINYVDHGFAKRALVGTLLRPLTGALDNPEPVIFWLMVAMSLGALVAILMLTQRFLPHQGGAGGDTTAILRCALAIGSLGVMQVAHDLGRLDMLNFALLIGAVALVARGRVWAAAGVSVIGVLIHEGFAVYGAPLVLAVGWLVARRDLSVSAAMRRFVPLVGLIAATSVAVLLWGNSDSAVMVPHGIGGYVWARGLVEYDAEITVFEILVLATYWAALGAVLISLCRGAGRGPDLILLALPLMLALNFLGIDHARWVTLAFYLLLITVAVQAHYFDRHLTAMRPWPRRLAIVLCLPLGPMGIVAPNAWMF